MIFNFKQFLNENDEPVNKKLVKGLSGGDLAGGLFKPVENIWGDQKLKFYVRLSADAILSLKQDSNRPGFKKIVSNLVNLIDYNIIRYGPTAAAAAAFDKPTSVEYIVQAYNEGKFKTDSIEVKSASDKNKEITVKNTITKTLINSKYVDDKWLRVDLDDPTLFSDNAEQDEADVKADYLNKNAFKKIKGLTGLSDTSVKKYLDKIKKEKLDDDGTNSIEHLPEVELEYAVGDLIYIFNNFEGKGLFKIVEIDEDHLATLSRIRLDRDWSHCVTLYKAEISTKETAVTPVSILKTSNGKYFFNFTEAIKEISKYMNLIASKAKEIKKTEATVLSDFFIKTDGTNLMFQTESKFLPIKDTDGVRSKLIGKIISQPDASGKNKFANYFAMEAPEKLNAILRNKEFLVKDITNTSFTLVPNENSINAQSNEVIENNEIVGYIYYCEEYNLKINDTMKKITHTEPQGSFAYFKKTKE